MNSQAQKCSHGCAAVRATSVFCAGLIAFVCAGALEAYEGARLVCDLTRDGAARFAGSCKGIPDGPKAPVTLTPIKVPDAQWEAAWQGSLELPFPAFRPFTLVSPSRHDQPTLFMSSQLGWFQVDGLVNRGDSMRFVVWMEARATPSEEDLAILKRAAKILRGSSVWNRKDDRNCPVNARSWSLYCALHDASLQVAGAYHHRRPAMEIVREVVIELAPEQVRKHELMDFNNSPETSFENLHRVLSIAVKRSMTRMASLNPQQN